MSECLALRDRYFAKGAPSDPRWIEHLGSCSECRQAFEALPQVDRALDEVGRLPVDVPGFDAVARLAASAARKQRRRRALRRSLPFFYTAVTTAALAAGFAAALLIDHAQKLAPKVLQPGAELHATSESKTAVLRNGARIRLDAGTLRLASTSPTGQALFLPSGRVSLEVPKLAPGTTLSVRTPDAEVRVRGTRFQVMRTDKGTQVSVTEGLVEVHPEGIGRPPQTLRAGESTTINSAEIYREELRRSTLEALDHGELTTAETQIGKLLGSAAEVAQKAEAQALLAWSLSAGGKRAEAIARYRQALVLLPQGQRPLWAENACAELAILLEQEKPAEAGAAWAECLRRFPEGVHAVLARSRVDSSR